MLTLNDIKSCDSFIVFIPKTITSEIMEEKIESKWNEIYEKVLNERYTCDKCLQRNQTEMKISKSFLLSDLECIRDNDNFEYFDGEELVLICEILGFYICGIDQDIFIKNIAYGEMARTIQKNMFHSHIKDKKISRDFPRYEDINF